MNERPPFRKLVRLWLVGMLGVVALAFTVLPSMLAGQELPLPLPILIAISTLQSGVFVAIAVAAGSYLGPSVGLRSAFVTPTPDGNTVLGKSLLPGFFGGLLGVLILLGANYFAPAEIRSVQENAPQIPLLARLLYGGITEEILIRFGLMSLIAWVSWKCLKGMGLQNPAPSIIVAIAISTLAFGAGHLPAVSAFGAEFTSSVVTYVLLWNSLFGVVAGLLFWKFSLEAAVVAHIIAHAGAYTFGA